MLNKLYILCYFSSKNCCTKQEFVGVVIFPFHVKDVYTNVPVKKQAIKLAWEFDICPWSPRQNFQFHTQNANENFGLAHKIQQLIWVHPCIRSQLLKDKLAPLRKSLI